MIIFMSLETLFDSGTEMVLSLFPLRARNRLSTDRVTPPLTILLNPKREPSREKEEPAIWQAFLVSDAQDFSLPRF
jgi:hypothetical protein